jgi:hypothetical protein
VALASAQPQLEHREPTVTANAPLDVEVQDTSDAPASEPLNTPTPSRDVDVIDVDNDRGSEKTSHAESDNRWANESYDEDDFSADAPPVVVDDGWEIALDEEPSPITPRGDRVPHQATVRRGSSHTPTHDASDLPRALETAAPSMEPAASPLAPLAPAVIIDVAPKSPQMMLLEDGPPPAAFAGCPHCRRPIPTGTIVCVGCGYNLLDGSINADAIYQPVTRLKPRSGWTGPLLLAVVITMAAAAGGYQYFGTRTGFIAFGIAFLIAVPLWFLWALADARDTEGAQLKIWLVPGYIFVWVFRESRSRYLRGATIGVVAIIIAFIVLGYEWRRIDREQQRAYLRGPLTTSP